METTLPVVAVTINGDFGAKDWRDPDKRGCVTQYLTLDQRREVVRRANAYPALIAALRKVAIGKPFEKRATDILRELGEAV